MPHPLCTVGGSSEYENSTTSTLNLKCAQWAWVSCVLACLTDIHTDLHHLLGPILCSQHERRSPLIAIREVGHTLQLGEGTHAGCWLALNSVVQGSEPADGTEHSRQYKGLLCHYTKYNECRDLLNNLMGGSNFQGRGHIKCYMLMWCIVALFPRPLYASHLNPWKLIIQMSKEESGSRGSCMLRVGVAFKLHSQCDYPPMCIYTWVQSSKRKKQLHNFWVALQTAAVEWSALIIVFQINVYPGGGWKI